MSSGSKPLPSDYATYMHNANDIRNVCILAHLNHGKTTIVDSLLATNRIITKRMIGDMRYLDDRDDEQKRGITMKSSAVSLINKISIGNNKHQQMLLTMVDTPGHIDFTSEVQTAVRVCDGALIIVDVVEGVSVQTREVIRLAFEEKLTMILIINKIDRLIVEQGKNVKEIFQLIIRSIENCNAIIAELYKCEYNDLEGDVDKSGLLFSPDKGNVIFASGIDGWGFTTRQIAEILVNLIDNETVESLNEKLWDFDVYIDSKKRIKHGAIERKKTNLFCKFGLETIYYVYDTLYVKMNRDKIDYILTKLMIKNVTREMRHPDSKILTRSILQGWKSLSDSILLQCYNVIPSPAKITLNRINYLLDSINYSENLYKGKIVEDVSEYLKNGPLKVETTPTIAYVTKMFYTSRRNLSQNKPNIFMPTRLTKPSTSRVVAITRDYLDTSVAIAFVRVFAGVIKTGQQLFVLPPNYFPEDNLRFIERVTVNQVYVLFGRDLLLVDEVPAGNICGISGIESTILRTGTLTSTLKCVPIIETLPMPIVRNTIAPTNSKDRTSLRLGLKALMLSDSCVQVVAQETGEYVLLTAGDVHLAKCIEDLMKFAKIPINVSSPMVSFRETIINTSDYDFRDDLENTFVVQLPQIVLSLIVVPLPLPIMKEIRKNSKMLSFIESHQKLSSFEIYQKKHLSTTPLSRSVPKCFKANYAANVYNGLKKNLDAAFDESPKSWLKLKNRIWSINQYYDCVNLMINYTNDYSRDIFSTIDEVDERCYWDSHLVSAFHGFCKVGPICGEPLTNCALVVKTFKYVRDDCVENINVKSNSNIELALRVAYRRAFEKQQQRLVEPIFNTQIQVNTNTLEKVCSVINRRHGKVLETVGMDEQKKQFLVKVQIPVMESNGFVSEIRKTTSGQATPTLKFSHYEIIDGNPLYEPTEGDEENDQINVEASIKAVNTRKEIRRRKGLYVEDQFNVVNIGRQRTLNRNN